MDSSADDPAGSSYSPLLSGHPRSCLDALSDDDFHLNSPLPLSSSADIHSLNSSNGRPYSSKSPISSISRKAYDSDRFDYSTDEGDEYDSFDPTLIDLDRANAFKMFNGDWKVKPPPQCPCPWMPVWMDILLLPWYIDDMENPECPCRVCKRFDRCCCKCCGLRIIRNILLSVGVFFFLWLLWCGVVGMNLAMAGYSFQVKSIKLDSMCDYELPIMVDLELTSTAWPTINLDRLSVDVRHKDSRLVFATLDYGRDDLDYYYDDNDLVEIEHLSLEYGTKSLRLPMDLEVLDIHDTGLALSMLLNATELHLEFDTSMTIFTNMLVFPLWLTVPFTLPFTFNGQQVQLTFHHAYVHSRFSFPLSISCDMQQ